MLILNLAIIIVLLLGYYILLSFYEKSLKVKYKDYFEQYEQLKAEITSCSSYIYLKSLEKSVLQMYSKYPNLESKTNKLRKVCLKQLENNRPKIN